MGATAVVKIGDLVRQEIVTWATFGCQWRRQRPANQQAALQIKVQTKMPEIARM